MAAFKFTFLLCAALLVFQAQAKPQTEVQSVGDIDIVGFLKNLLVIVENAFDQAIALAEAILKRVTTDQYDDLRSQIVGIANDAIGKLLDSALIDLDAMGEQSTPAGKKLAGCIRSSRDDILALPVTFGDDVLKCIGTDLVAFVQSLGPVVKDLEAVHVDAKAAAEKINDCEGNDIQGLLCVAQVAAELLDVLSEIPETIQANIEPVKVAAKNLYDSLSQCTTDEVNVFYKNSGKVLDKVSTCVAA